MRERGVVTSDNDQGLGAASSPDTAAALTACGVGTCGPDDNQAQAGHLIAGQAAGSIAKPLGAGENGPRYDLDNDTYVATVRMREGCEGGGKGPLVTENFSATLATRNDQVLSVARMRGFGDYVEDDCASALKARDYKDHTDLVCGVADPVTASEGKTYTHEGTHNFRLHNVVSVAENQRAEVVEAPVTQALSTGGGKMGQGYPAVAVEYTLRRLTPLECERLQGFPDGHTAVPFAGKEVAADSHRYKAIGNSMAVPVMHYVGRRIQLWEEVTA